MKTKTINLYSFDELSEDAKQKAIEKLWDINVGYEWWEFVEEDAKNIGLDIKEFDIDRQFIKGELLRSAAECAELILKEHVESCDTYKLAQTFLKEHDELVEKFSDGIKLDRVDEDKEYEYDQESDEQDEEFKNSLLEEYLVMLRKSYEDLTSKEQIIETIRSNEYDFDEEGNLI